MISANLSAIFYLVSGILFILALRGLSSPETSRQGNLFGILGMIIAITVTFLTVGNFSTSTIYVFIFLLVGGAIGAFIAFKIPMNTISLLKFSSKPDLIEENDLGELVRTPRSQLRQKQIS